MRAHRPDDGWINGILWRIKFEQDKSGYVHGWWATKFFNKFLI